MENYVDFAVQKAVELLAIDSPTGYTAEAEEFVLREFRALGFAAERTAKGGILIDLGGENADDALLLEAHADTLGGMVAEIKGDGRLRIVNVGGMNANNAEAENCRVVTKFSGSYEGTLQLINASVHVNGDYASTKRSWDTVEVVLDEAVESADDVKALGISVGDFVCFEPRTRVTKSGYIKSRFLDDKLSVGILLGFAKYLHDEGKTPARRVYAHVTVYEEVGHGGSASVPAGVTEAISVDMGCVGAGLQCTERQVSICAKDSGGPYSYDVVKKLIAAAQKSRRQPAPAVRRVDRKVHDLAVVPLALPVVDEHVANDAPIVQQGQIDRPLVRQQLPPVLLRPVILREAQPVKGNDGVIFRKCESFLFHILLQTPFPGNP